MKVVDEISNLLKIIGKASPQVENHLVFEESIKLFSGDNRLLEVDESQLKLCGHDLLNKLLAKTDKSDQKIKSKELANFLDSISDSFLRLNHVGISYAVANIDSEISLIKNIVQNTSMSLYEEPSGDPKAKWLFVGNAANWKSPLFEIVLTSETNTPENLWRPHFQLDIDTNLEQQKLEKYLMDCFGSDFIQWKLDIPNYGVCWKWECWEVCMAPKFI